MENQSTTASSSSSSSSQMQFLLLEQVEFLDVKDESLLQWELVNVVDSEEQEEEEEVKEEKDSVEDGFGSWDSPTFSPKETPIEGITGFLLHHHHHLVDDDVADVEVKDHHHEDENEDDDHDDDDDDDDGLDDELVPWNVSDKLGRQRMRKLGKRAFPRMHNSKRSPILFVTPGCVRGKHGLGLKHNY
ncbi:hypothetical protein RIF29_32337 [Crotalaria pallida]|uniref:Uncharacterized protein n=1 Tax=Crotalaria pallida TaxID=3830 RepID=A0AAN9HXM9_CROPI